jgi:hypothetical protein
MTGEVYLVYHPPFDAGIAILPISKVSDKVAKAFEEYLNQNKNAYSLWEKNQVIGELGITKNVEFWKIKNLNQYSETDKEKLFYAGKKFEKMPEDITKIPERV